MGVLPFLPGYTFDEKFKRTKFHKSQALGVVNNFLQVWSDKPGIGGELLPYQTSRSNVSDIPSRKGGIPQPRWLAYGDQTLCFKAYWQESVTEMRHEFFRVHRVIIFFFIEDDTIQVANDRELNTGLPEGIIRKRIYLKRHRIKRPPPDDDKFYTIEDFNIGKEVTFYGKTFLITAYGDLFTERFLKNLGYRVYESIDPPLDPATEHIKKDRESDSVALRPHSATDNLRQFLQFDKNVLRFTGYWDDTESLFGDVHELIILYYLVDDTIEILEKIPPNSGREKFPIFLKRGKLPKKVPPLLFPGHSKFPVLNVLSTGGPCGEYYIQDALKMGRVDVDCYKDTDLTIGAFINAWGRKVVLCDCDNFTQEYYRSKYGITDFTPLEQVRKEKPSLPQKEIPPHNGFGSEEDSLRNVLQLLPTPPKKDFIKFITLDRQKADSHILRFLAKFTNETPLTEGRLFVISFCLMDDTIYIHELTRRNTGIYGGKFLERTKIKKPTSDASLLQYYKAEDFYVGAHLELNSFKFTIIDADEYCLRYMEDHSQQFLQANLNFILSKIKEEIADNLHEAKKTMAKCDLEDKGITAVVNFRDTLLQLVPYLNEHEILTLVRHYGKRVYADIYNINFLLALAQRDLHRAHFDDFERLLIHFKRYDSKRSGRLSRKDFYNACRSIHLPVGIELLKLLIDKLEPVGSDEICYTEAIDLLNWRRAPLDGTLPPHVVFDTAHIECQQSFEIRHVNYIKFFADVEKH